MIKPFPITSIKCTLILVWPQDIVRQNDFPTDTNNNMADTESAQQNLLNRAQNV